MMQIRYPVHEERAYRAKRRAQMAADERHKQRIRNLASGCGMTVKEYLAEQERLAVAEGVSRGLRGL